MNLNTSNKIRQPLTCGEAQDCFQGLMNARLGPAVRGRLEAHLLVCQDCSEVWGLALDEAIERGEIEAPAITEIPPVPGADVVPVLSGPEKSRLFGALWTTLRERAAQGEDSARRKLESLSEELNNLAGGWQPAFSRVLGPTSSATAPAQMLNDAYELVDETCELKVTSPPVITADGRFDARFAVAKKALKGRTVALTICDETKMLVTFTSTLKVNAAGQLEAVFEEEGFDLPPRLVSSENFILHIWPEQK